MNVSFFELKPFFHSYLQGGRNFEDSNMDFFQLDQLPPIVSSSTPLVRIKSPNIIVPDLNETSSFNNDITGPSLVSSHKDHDSKEINGKERGAKNTSIIPVDLVYLRKDTSQRKTSTDPVHYHESTNSPSKIFPETTQSNKSIFSLSPRFESSESYDYDIPIAIKKVLDHVLNIHCLIMCLTKTLTQFSCFVLTSIYYGDSKKCAGCSKGSLVEGSCF